jgi:hypothetical protein
MFGKFFNKVSELQSQVYHVRSDFTAMVKQFSTCRWAGAIYPAYAHFAIQKRPYERDCCIQQCKNMNITCHTYGKVFNNLSEGVQYSSTTRGFPAFCSDECCKDYLVSAIN